MLWKESLKKVNKRPDKILSLLGLAARSRNLASGEVAVEKAVTSGKAWLVIVPEDASDNTVKKFTNMCEFREIPYFRYGTKETLGHAIGKEERSSLAVLDGGFADGILKLLESRNDVSGGNC